MTTRRCLLGRSETDSSLTMFARKITYPVSAQLIGELLGHSTVYTLQNYYLYLNNLLIFFRIVRNKTSERIRQTLNSHTATAEEAQLLLTPGEKAATKASKTSTKKQQKRTQNEAVAPPHGRGENFGVQQSPTPGFTPSMMATPTSPVAASQGNTAPNLATILGFNSVAPLNSTPSPSNKRKISTGKTHNFTGNNSSGFSCDKLIFLLCSVIQYK